MSTVIDFFPRRSINPSPVSTETTDNKVVKETKKVAIPIIKESADFDLTRPFSEVTYCVTDGAGGGPRQLANAINAIIPLVPISQTALHISAMVVPFSFMFTGLMCTLTAIFWTIPDAYAALKSAFQERKDAITPDAMREAKRELSSSGLGFGNHLLYLTMGLSQMSSGIVTALTPTAAKILNYTPILTGAAAKVALLATGIGLGAVYVARGGVMLCRAITNYYRVHDFRKQFEKCVKQDPIKFMQEANKIAPDYYLARRVNKACLEKKDANGNISEYTAEGIKTQQGITPYSPQERLEYLQRVDKGIYHQELTHKLAIVIAIAMILGGITAIVLTILTGGIAPLVIALVSAIFFMCMEYAFMTYDSTRLFDWLRDLLYARPKWLRDPISPKVVYQFSTPL